jgi:desumoylating isopeptidase 1
MTEVYLHVYDLSEGMAKQFSPMLLGKTIEGVWHTGICIFGREYYYGDGICSDSPKATPYGNPYKIVKLGTTEIPFDVFTDFLREISPKYTFATYHVLEHNCNTFTNEISEFLVGESIPAYITNLPAEFLQTQLGQMIKPMIDGFTQNIKTNSNPLFMDPPTQPQPNPPTQLPQPSQNTQISNEAVDLAAQLSSILGGQNTAPAQRPPQAPSSQEVLEIKSIQQLESIIASTPGVIVDFWSPQCGPCLQFKPYFEQKAKSNTLPSLQFCSVNVKQVAGVHGKYSIKAIPLFHFYSKGELISHFKGASQSKFNFEHSTLYNILQSSQPEPQTQSYQSPSNPKAHPSLLELKTTAKDPLLFTTTPPKATQSMISSLQSAISTLTAPPTPILLNSSLEALSSYLTSFSPKTATPQILNQLFTLLPHLKIEHKIAVCDLLRSIVVKEDIVKQLFEKEFLMFDAHFLKPVCEEGLMEGRKMQNFNLIVLRVVCNLFASRSGREEVCSTAFLDQLVVLCERSLKSGNGKVRQTAAVCLYNLRVFMKVGVKMLEKQSARIVNALYKAACWNERLLEEKEKVEVAEVGSTEEKKEIPIIEESKGEERKIPSGEEDELYAEAICVALFIFKSENKKEDFEKCEEYKQFIKKIRSYPSERVKRVGADILNLLKTP